MLWITADRCGSLTSASMAQIGALRLILRQWRGCGLSCRGVLIKRSSGRQDPMFIGVLPVRSAVSDPSGRRQVSPARRRHLTLDPSQWRTSTAHRRTSTALARRSVGARDWWSGGDKVSTGVRFLAPLSADLAVAACQTNGWGGIIRNTYGLGITVVSRKTLCHSAVG